MSRTIVVIGAGGIDRSTVQGGELFAPVCRKARSAGKQERGKWPSEQHLGRAGATGTRRVAPFQETALERIAVQVAVVRRLQHKRFQGFHRRFCVAIRLRVVGRRRDMINLPGSAEIGEALRREVRTVVGCQGLVHAKASEPTAKNLDDGGRICRASEVGETRPSRQTISVGQILPSLTREQVGRWRSKTGMWAVA